jgi:hypothetical protein
MDQRVIDERIRRAQQKRHRGEKLTDYEWMLVTYANQRCMPTPPDHRLHILARG